MVLEELHELIETLQKRIDTHASALQQSEALTRYALIDPLLRALGWDTGDPKQVIPEYPVTNGSADYALFGQSMKPAVIVEAKKLGTPLGGAINQVINYCMQDGYEHFSVTDGRFWRLYETNRKGALSDKLIVDLDLRGPIAKTCLDALALWRPAVEASHVQPANSPVISDSQPTIGTDGSEAPEVHEAGWHHLAAFVPGKRRPAQVRFPSGAVAAADSWGRVTKSIVQWLSDQGHLTTHHLPIRTPKHKVLVIEQSANTSGQTLSKVGQFLVNANFTANPQVANSRQIIERTGLNPDEFAVKLQ